MSKALSQFSDSEWDKLFDWISDTEDMTDEEVRHELERLNIDIAPAVARLHRIIAEYKHKLFAKSILQVLVEECGASESIKDEFIAALDNQVYEFRFQGNLGFCGKIYLFDRHEMRVVCDPENEERLAMITKANERLDLISREKGD